MLTPEQLESSIARATAYLEGAREPHALLFMTILHRRFGIEAFADADARYDKAIPEHPDRAPVLRVFRRVFDAENPLVPEDWEHVTIPTDQLLVTGLYCDRLGVPSDFGDTLERAVSQGGYGLTHAVLAWAWANENGCHLRLADSFLDEMFDRCAAIINDDPTSIDDLKLEAGAFLCIARQSGRVNLGFVQRVFAVQNEDGGWGAKDDSNWHATILALMIVLHVQISS